MINKIKPYMRVFSWYYLIVTVIVYGVIIYEFGFDRTALISQTIIWYPFFCYYLTDVKFYEDYLTIKRPLLLFFPSKKILYNEIILMKMTEGRGPMIKVCLRDNSYKMFTPPLSNKKQQKLSIYLKTKGIDLVC